jgi:hypothetical protein
MSASLSGDIMPLLVFLVFVVFAFIGVYLNWLRRKRFGELLQAMSSKLGCRFHPGGWFSPPMLEGTFRGHKIQVDTFNRRSGKHSYPYTRVQVWHNGKVDEEMTLEPESLATWVTKKFGAQDAHVGGRDFDEAYRVGIKDKSKAAELLDYGIRHKLLDTRIKFQVRLDAVYHEEAGLAEDAEKLLTTINILSDITERVEKIWA